MNGDNGLGLFCDGLGDMVGLHQQCVVVYINKYGLGAGEHNLVHRGGKGHGRGDDLVAFAYTHGLEQQVHACSARAQGKRMGGAGVPGKVLFKPGAFGPGGYPAGLYDLGDGIDFFNTEIRFAHGYEFVHSY